MSGADQESLAVRRAEAERFLLDRINYETFRSIPYSQRNLKLDRMRRLLSKLGDPDAGMPIVHVAGTKGKGSTSALIAGILHAAGYDVGVFSSPHMNRLEERFSINGVPCPAEQFVGLVEQIRPVVRQLDEAAVESGDPQVRPTFFELVTAVALMHFAQRRVDAVVLEVGLGGRLDSTNVCQPLVTVITAIGFDHMKQLGSTLEEIAAEKAGIVKPGVPLVCGRVAPGPRAVIAGVARKHGCRVIEAGRDFSYRYEPPSGGRRGTLDYRREGGVELSGAELAMVGQHQAANAAAAVAALGELRDRGWSVPDEAIVDGLRQTSLPGRFEIVEGSPTVVLDAAHNMPSAEALAATLESLRCPPGRVLLYAGTREKDIRGMVRALLPAFRHVVVTQYRDSQRAVDPEAAAAMFREEAALLGRGADNHKVLVAEDSASGLDEACRLAGGDQWVCITGSFFIVAELRARVLAAAKPRQPGDCSRESDQMSQST
ncbi:MAG: folylpolyglutamate synthase/dihydrofolate synthase family protein [Planctomycetota bacterium]